VTIELRMADGEGALERLLQALRRRGVRLGRLAVVREPGGFRVTLEGEGRDPVSVLALLSRLHDVLEARHAA